MVTILDLPPELLLLVFGYMGLEELSSLRATNKWLDQKCLEYFGRRFFEVRCFMVTSSSLNVLLGIARQPRLQSFVRDIWISPALFEFQHNMTLEDFSFEVPPKPHRRRWYTNSKRIPVRPEVAHGRFEAYQVAVADHRDIVLSGKIRNCFLEVFTSLPNMRSFGIRFCGYEDNCEQPYYLRTLGLQGKACPGRMSLKEATGRNPIEASRTLVQELPVNGLNVRNEVLSAALAASIACGRKLGQLRTSDEHCCGMVPAKLLLTQEQMSALPLALSELRKLQLAPRGSTCGAVFPPENYDCLLKILLAAAPSLEELSMAFDRRESATQSFSRMSSAVRFTCLRQFDMFDVCLTHMTLLRFLMTARQTLRTLRMHTITLLESDNSKRWSAVLQDIVKEMELDRISLSSLYTSSGPARIRDPLHGRYGSNSLVNCTDYAYWEREKALVSAADWADCVLFFSAGDPEAWDKA